MKLLSSGAVVFLSSDAQPSHTIDVRPKSPHRMSSRATLDVDVAEDGTEPVWGTLQFWIFLFCITTGAFDVFTRRDQLWEVHDLVAAL